MRMSRPSTCCRRTFWCVTARRRRCAWPATIPTGPSPIRSTRSRDGIPARTIWPRNKVALAANLGSYGTVAGNACISCHTPHNALGPARLLHGPNEQDCAGCHSGGTNLTPAIPNVFAEFAKTGHPFPAGQNTHDAAEDVLLNNNRHATCADCHNGHGSQQVATFPPPPAIRVSQNGVAGISASDGTTIVNPSVNQYENCLRCHGNSTGKVSNPDFRISAAAGGFGERSAECDSAVQRHRHFEPSGNARPQQSAAAAQLAADYVG